MLITVGDVGAKLRFLQFVIQFFVVAYASILQHIESVAQFPRQ